MPNTPSLAEILTAHTGAALEDLHVSLPGSVVTYYPDTQTADVQPMVKRALATEDGDMVHEELPIIPHVPVAFPRGSGFMIVFPLSAGDTVWLVFSSSASGIWQATGEHSEPGDLRRHGLGYCVAIPGGYPDPKAATDAGTGKFVIGKDGNSAQIRISPDLIELGAAVAAFAARADLTDQAIANIRAAYNLHVHPAPGGTTSATAQQLGPQTSVAAAKVKVE